MHSHSKSNSFMQCCGSGSAWIHIHFGCLNPDPGGQKITEKCEEILSFEVLDDIFCGSVADPDPYVFGPPGSRSISTMYGSGSGSFYQAKTVRKALIPTVLWLFMSLAVFYVPNFQFPKLPHFSSERDIKWFPLCFMSRTPRKICENRKTVNDQYLVSLPAQLIHMQWKFNKKIPDPASLVRGADPDPYHYVTDPQHCL